MFFNKASLFEQVVIWLIIITHKSEEKLKALINQLAQKNACGKKKRVFSFLITDKTKLLYYPASLDHTSISNVIISVGKSNYICISYEHVKTKPPQLNIVKSESAALGEATYKTMSWSHWLLLLEKEKLNSAICSHCVLLTTHSRLWVLLDLGSFSLAKRGKLRKRFSARQKGENWPSKQSGEERIHPQKSHLARSFTRGRRGQDIVIRKKPGKVKATSPFGSDSTAGIII